MLTVQEPFLFAANLRLPEGIPEVEKQKRVDNVLEKLGLEHLRDTRIGDNTGSKARGTSKKSFLVLDADHTPKASAVEK